MAPIVSVQADIFSTILIARPSLMIRKTLALLALLALGACAANNAVQLKNCPPEGGIGGTGGCPTYHIIS